MLETLQYVEEAKRLRGRLVAARDALAVRQGRVVDARTEAIAALQAQFNALQGAPPAVVPASVWRGAWSRKRESGRSQASYWRSCGRQSTRWKVSSTWHRARWRGTSMA